MFLSHISINVRYKIARCRMQEPCTNTPEVSRSYYGSNPSSHEKDDHPQIRADIH